MSEQGAVAVLALGANLGERIATLRAAVADIASLTGVHFEWVSPLVESVALTLSGTDETAPKYINCVMQVRATLEPLALLHELQAIEQAHGRVRGERWASRTLDIDIVQIGAHEEHSPELTLPHPEASKRNFVLWPWQLADPTATLVGHGRIADLPTCTQHELTVLAETIAPSGAHG